VKEALGEIASRSRRRRSSSAGWEARKAGHNHLLGVIQLILEGFDRHELLINDIIQDDVHQKGRPFPDTLDFVIHNTFDLAQSRRVSESLRR